jgi:hypothetical protein
MNLIFFCPTVSKPTGGVRAIYRLAEAFQELLSPENSTSTVCHPNRFFYKYKWLDSKINVQRKFFGLQWSGKPSFSRIRPDMFDSETDVIVIPELWVRKYACQLIELGIPYIILVQGGYLISKGDRIQLTKGYEGAALIMCVSEDSGRCIATAFPTVKPKIHRFHLWVDADLFSPANDKELWISYMPRKLRNHADLLKFFVGDRLPPGWKWVPIHGQEESGVARLLSKSKIFVSFNHMEGLGLPPIEAALAGNQVIGYTGEGGKDYWQDEIFQEIHYGNLLAFSDSVVQTAKELNDDKHDKTQILRAQLASKFSKNSMMNDLKAVLLNLKQCAG